MFENLFKRRQEAAETVPLASIDHPATPGFTSFSDDALAGEDPALITRIQTAAEGLARRYVAEHGAAAREAAEATSDREAAYLRGLTAGARSVTGGADRQAIEAAVIRERSRWGEVFAGLVEGDARAELACHLLASTGLSAAQVTTAALKVPERGGHAADFAKIMARHAVGAPATPTEVADLDDSPSNPSPQRRAEFAALFTGVQSPLASGDVAATIAR